MKIAKKIIPTSQSRGLLSTSFAAPMFQRSSHQAPRHHHQRAFASHRIPAKQLTQTNRDKLHIAWLRKIRRDSYLSSFSAALNSWQLLPSASITTILPIDAFLQLPMLQQSPASSTPSCFLLANCTNNAALQRLLIALPNAHFGLHHRAVSGPPKDRVGLVDGWMDMRYHTERPISIIRLSLVTANFIVIAKALV